VGGATLTKVLADHQAVPWEEAEALKCGPAARGLSAAVEPVISSLCQQIQNTLHAFRFEVMAEATADKILITGGGALFPGLPEMLGNYLELPVEPLDLAQHKGIQVSEEAMSGWDPSFMNTALALATRDQRGKNSFNLRVGKFTKKRKYDQLKQELGRLGVYALIAFVALSGSFFAEYYVLKKRQDNYEKEITQIFKKTLPEVTRIVNPVQQLKVAVNSTKGAMLLPQQSAGRGATIELLRDIFVNIPQSVPLDLDRLTIDETRVRLRGNTNTFNSVDKIKGGLAQSSYFTSVSIASAQLDRGGNTIRFELLMEQP
jgi:hypothetical protein